MQTYDDRPISMYDNLNVSSSSGTAVSALHTSTPKTKTPQQATSSFTPTSTQPSMESTTTNGATQHSPYSEIQFQFNNNNNNNKPETLLPNGNRSTSQLQASIPSNTPYYSTPFKTAKTPSSALITTNPTASTAQNSTAISTFKASPAQRPLSQHSQSELNDTCQSIAAVKAALNDAKSKFFGLNGYAVDNSNSPYHSIESQQPATKQPKYQNIPENSAIFRQQQKPPELPPKPNLYEFNNSKSNSPSSLSSTPSLLSGRNSTEPSQTSHSVDGNKMPVPLNSNHNTEPSTSATSKLLPHSSYKPMALNDIESTTPSQAVYMSTTVPQNIKGTKIAGRHTPTRNSLRHSRMLVVNNKNYQGVQHPNPMNFKYPNVARWLLILQILIGVFLLFLCLWIFMLAPNSAIQDNPYWSALALILAGILGLVLIRYQRIKRNKVRENCFIFLRADSIVISLLALLLCAVAFICASLQYVRLSASDTKCVSTNILEEHGSCTCTFNALESANNSTSKDYDMAGNGLLQEEIMDYEDNSYAVEYRDLSCSELHCEWFYMLGTSIILNAIGVLLTLTYIVLLACCRISSKRFYNSVHTSTF